MILFRTAGGPRIGSGHFVRTLRLAALAGVPATVSVRGGRAARLRVRPGACVLMEDRGPRATFADARPSLLVVDDPNEAAAAPWVRMARHHGCAVIGIVDAGIGTRTADLIIDSSAARARRELPSHRTLRGPRYAVIDPAAAAPRTNARKPHEVLIALGGGPRSGYALRVAQAIVDTSREARVIVAGGFVGGPPPHVPSGVRWLGPQRSLVPWLEAATVAVVAGGITLYEACALGTPTVATPVVGLQQAAVLALARRGAVVTAAWPSVLPCPASVATRVGRLLARRADRALLAGRARQTVDGRGAFRVAYILRGMAGGRTVGEIIARERSDHDDTRIKSAFSSEARRSGDTT